MTASPMDARQYIKVLIPLRLEWEPLYSWDGPVPAVAGDRIRVAFAGKEYIGVVTDPDAGEEAAAVGLSRIRPALAIEDSLPRISEEETGLWRQVAGYYLCTVGEVYKAAYPAGKVAEEEAKARIAARLKERLERKEKQIASARRDDTRARYESERDALQARLSKSPLDVSALAARAGSIVLTAAQQAAFDKVKESIRAGKPALLHGVTGSGKTEIYMKLAGEVLMGGKNVLYLVPEIALGKQLEERIGEMFPELLRVCHSGESMARRLDTAEFIRAGSYLVLGTRSAVFLPHRNLGLVIIDEEHDSSYKQDSPAPRYNARETAIMMARIFGAGTVLGSATPSLESLYNCSAGRFSLVPLTQRYYDAADSDIEIIDTIAERRKNGMVGHFSRKLISRIEGCLAAGEQAVILRERRAYAPMVQCEECGQIPRCSRCNVPLSLHKRPDGGERLLCHYCGRVYEYTGRCAACGGSLRPLGSGTQKIEEEVKALFPSARVARLDSDAARSSGYESEVIRQFSRGELDILIGTQIVTKGFDFSGLTLVAVLQADSLLGQEDYKADEKALQMLEQFRGRCGRRGTKGMFVVQTSQPGHPVYTALEGKAGLEETRSRFLQERKVFGYPPYSRIVALVVKDGNLARLERLCRDLAEDLGRLGFRSRVQVAGPYAPAVDMVSGKHIRKIRVLLPKDRFLSENKAILKTAVEAFGKDRKYPGHIALDVDPV